MKKFNIFISILFSIFLSILFITNIIIPDKKFSDIENRYLAQIPVFSIKKLLDGSFTKNFEIYIQDQFFKRDFWIKLKTESDKLINKHDINGAYIGENDWYFEKKDTLSEDFLDENIYSLLHFAEWSEKNNISTTFLPIYSSHNIYNEFMPLNAPAPNEMETFDYISQIINNKIIIVDIYPNLFKHKNEYIYFKTDHHWTQRGAFYAYQEFCKSMGFNIYDTNDFKKFYSENDFYGSLYSKAPLWGITSDKIEIFQLKEEFKIKYDIEYLDTQTKDISLYKWENLNKKDKYTVFLGGNNSIVTIKSTINNDKKLLVIKDSFAHTLIPFLANHYSEIHVIDLRYYKQSLKKYVSEKEITSILFIYNLSWFVSDKNIRSLKY